ncbi:ADP-dependent glucokinase/phosphofructokinase [Demequina lignilytica]|uniref:ADP-dependent glucokinase/phosphofructokinase n=1 Tax=Demequina lignilytica TaxID=3051663 RepID=A0AB35MHD6_9MICO|nr:ADP-dependent glucokinase/phosphofructokinase [Demequina sp. SYSU T0a273]MDN4483163.1 ADP-dependent glucokinase/phosphofructokinase [Demequina sp. SYSU T0a273]
MIADMDGAAAAGAEAGAAVLGLGGCLDYEITWDVAALEELARRHGIVASELERGDVIGSERDLVRSILAFLRDGVGGERAVAALEPIEALSRMFERRITLGGTSVRAALAMSRIGVPSTLHLVSVDDHVRRLLPADVVWICSGDEDTLNPHLIVQFPRGARVRLADGTELVAPASNRLIYVCDRPNTEMIIDPGLGDLLEDARLFLISGLNAMVSEAALRARIQTMRDAIERMPAGSLVVFEDAGYHVPELADVLIRELSDVVDVYGMNEDELATRVGRDVDLLDPADVADALATLRALIPGPTLVVHTSAWALAYGPGAARFADALDAGSALAGTRYLHGDALDADLYAATMRLPRQERGVAFAEGIEALLGDRVACRAARVLDTDSPTTIGLGDTFVGGVVAALVSQAATRSRA